MQVLLSEDFSGGALPPGWFCDSPHYRFTPAGLHAGRETGFVIPLPGHGWRALRVEVELAEAGSRAYCAWDGVLALSLTLRATPFPRHEVLDYHTVTAHGTTPLPAPGEGRRLAFDFRATDLAAAVEGVEIVRGENRRGGPFTGGVHLVLAGDAIARRVRILGEEPLAGPLYPTPPRSRADYLLEAAVDFTDDLICAPYTEAMYDAYFRELACWGTRRVHWIFNGRREEGQLDHWPLGADVHIAQTMARVGELFAAAARAAHRHGMEMYAVVKPFDMGFFCSYGEGTAEARARGRLARIGGPVGWITHVAARHRELAMARRPGAFGDALNRTFTRIDLVKEDDGPAAIRPDDIAIFVSDDNATYRLYAEPVARSEVVENYPRYVHTPSGPRLTAETVRCRAFRLDGLRITEKYVALLARGSARSFANRLQDLLHVYGERGEETFLTYAGKARTGAYAGGGAAVPFDRIGLEFDHYPAGSPTAGAGGGFDGYLAPFVLDGGAWPAAMAPAGQGDDRVTLLAFARGKERGTLAALSPSFPETRQWWLGWVRDALAMGADGIEFRVGNHHADFTYREYGFEPPVRDAFLARYGIDIWSADDFDRAAWRRLRGEAYTQFYREAHRLIASQGKRMGLHIGLAEDTEPELGGAMDIHWDWRGWLREGLADSVTLKALWPDSRLFQEILSLTRPRGIPAIFSPYAINYFSPYGSAVRKAGGERRVDDLIAWGKRAGCDGFQFYETACALEGSPDGTVRLTEPALREVFRAHFVRP